MTQNELLTFRDWMLLAVTAKAFLLTPDGEDEAEWMPESQTVIPQ